MFELILVDDKDNIIGYGEKMQVHLKGELHRAFSVFIWDNNRKELLIQKRAANKYHSGGKWSNSCCSHPYKGETIEESVSRCVLSELGADIDVSGRIKELGKFLYMSDYNGIYEHEIDNVIILYADKSEFPESRFIRDEIEELNWLKIDKLNAFHLANRDSFSSWFEKAYSIFLSKSLCS